MIFYPIDDQAAAQRRYEAKELDVSYGLPLDQLKRLKASFGAQVHATPALDRILRFRHPRSTL